MDIFVPRRNLWIPDNVIADSDASPIGIDRMIRHNRSICSLSPHRGLLGAAGTVTGDQTSYSFDGTGDWLTAADHADWELDGGASNDWTIDFWLWITSLPAGNLGMIGQQDDSDNRWGLKWNNNGGGNYDLRIQVRASGSNTMNESGASIAPTTGAWQHIACVVNGANSHLFIDGTQTGSTGSSGNVPDLSDLLHVGHNNFDTELTGRMDEIRVSTTARWTTTFTPETTEYSSDANTSLLIHCGETLVSGTTGSGATFNDSGNTTHLMTEVANAIRDTTTFKI